MIEGKLIVLEGIDGSGKTTNIPVVKSILTEMGVPSLSTAEPGGTDLGGWVRGLVKTQNHDFSPDVLAMLMCTARLHHIEKVIKPALDGGMAVVCDRYWASTIAYQCGGMGVDLDDLLRIAESFSFDAGKVDLQLYFKVTHEQALARANTRLDNKADYFDSKGEEFFNRVIDMYDQIAAANTVDNITIDASVSPEEVEVQIRKALYKLYPEKRPKT